MSIDGKMTFFPTDSKMVEHFEYGYIITGGVAEHRIVWAVDHGADGTWTPAQNDINLGSIDIYDDAEDGIREALLKAGVPGVVLRRRVTVVTGPVEAR